MHNGKISPYQIEGFNLKHSFWLPLLFLRFTHKSPRTACVQVRGIQCSARLVNIRSGRRKQVRKKETSQEEGNKSGRRKQAHQDNQFQDLLRQLLCFDILRVSNSLLNLGAEDVRCDQQRLLEMAESQVQHK